MKFLITAIFAFTLLIVACANRTSETANAVGKTEVAYFVFNYRIGDSEAYRPYLAQVPETLEAYGAEVVVADFESDVVEGNAGNVTVVLRFASEEAARGWYQSPEYQEIVRLRTENSSGVATIASAADD